ncbi:MAG: DMT family transporter [Desulfovibrio sp.]|nr:DMT family transporter [Desulfovibrio sp.]MBI4960543.1 DMT family transporter [Desulfovibrio sp.]
MLQNARIAGYLAALAATVIWAGNFVLARGVAQHIPPIQLNFWRWVLALACMLPIALPKLRADWPGMRRQWRYLFLMALVGVSGLNALIYKAGQTTQSLNMALLVPTAPIMIIIMSRIFYGEPITYRRLAGVGVVLLGVLALISRGDWQHLASVKFTPGDLWALAGAACFAVYSLFIRRRPADISIEGFNAAMFTAGIVLMIPALAWEAAVSPAPVWNGPVIVAVLYAGIGCSFAAYLLWTKAISIIGPVLAGIVYYSLPLFAAIESVVILDEHIALFHVFGGGLIIAGILIATLDKDSLWRRA